MEEFLTQYSLEFIIIFVFGLAGLVKAAISLWDWFAQRVLKIVKKKTKDEKLKEEIIANIQEVIKHQKQTDTKVSNLTNSVKLLMDSDKDDIKAWITEKHHFFCYEQGYIDDYSLDCIEKRYSHYLDEGGNSYVATLMGEIRSLPKHKQ